MSTKPVFCTNGSLKLPAYRSRGEGEEDFWFSTLCECDIFDIGGAGKSEFHVNGRRRSLQHLSGKESYTPLVLLSLKGLFFYMINFW